MQLKGKFGGWAMSIWFMEITGKQEAFCENAVVVALELR